MRNKWGPVKRLAPFVLGSPFYHQVPLEIGALIGQMMVLLNGTFTVAGGAANGAFIGENPGGLIASMEVDAVAAKAGYKGGVLKSLTSRSILRRRAFDHGRIIADTVLTGAAGSFTVAQPYFVQFAIPRLKDTYQWDTALECSAYSSVRLTVQTQTQAVFNPTTDRTWTVSGLNIDVYDDRSYPPQAKKHAELYETDLPFIINAANARTPIGSELAQDGGYLDFLMLAQTTAAITLSDAVIQRVIWQAGTTQLYDGTSAAIKAQQHEYITDTAEVQTGEYFTPFDRDGMLSSAEFGLSGTLDLLNPGGAGLDQITVASRRVNLAPLA